MTARPHYTWLGAVALAASIGMVLFSLFGYPRPDARTSMPQNPQDVRAPLSHNIR